MNGFVTHYGLLALFLLAFVKAVGIPIPIPADFLVLGAATGSASGKFVAWEAFLLLLAAMTVGGFVQYSLVRGPGRGIIFGLGQYVGLTRVRLDLMFDRLSKVGIGGIAVATVTPGIRTAAIPACGIIPIPVRRFILGLVTGTSLFLGLQFLLGYAGAAVIVKAWEDGSELWVLPAVAFVLAAVIVVVHLRHHMERVRRASDLSGLAAYGCPLCWTVGTISSRRDRVRPIKNTSAKHASVPIETGMAIRRRLSHKRVDESDS